MPSNECAIRAQSFYPDGVKYLKPDQSVITCLDAPATPGGILSPDGRRLLLVDHEPHPPIALLARPYRGLAGVRIDTEHGWRRRTTALDGLTIIDVSTGTSTNVVVKGSASIGAPLWASDSRHFSFTVDAPSGLELHLHDGQNDRLVEGIRLSDILSGGQLGGRRSFIWSRDSREIWVAAIPPARRPPREHEIGPTISETSGSRSQMPIFSDLLRSVADADEFEFWATTQLMRIDVETGTKTCIGNPALLIEVTPSPDDQYLLVERLQRPFSSRVPYKFFARRTEIWDRRGSILRVIADLPVSDQIPPRGVPTGPRAANWHEGRPSMLTWTEACDDGNPDAVVQHRDRLLHLASPFDGQPVEWLRLKHRWAGTWSLEEGSLVREFDRGGRMLTTWHVEDGLETSMVMRQSQNEAYEALGTPVCVRLARGTRVVVQHGSRILMEGAGATPTGNRPFVGWFDLKARTSERVVTSAALTQTERVGLVDRNPQVMVVREQSSESVSNFLVLNTTSGSKVRLTAFENPHPHVKLPRPELYTCVRHDGVALSGLLHRPPGHSVERDGPLPTILWAYPMDYADGVTAGQVRASVGAFKRLASTSPVWMTLFGFAVVTDATMPIVGDTLTKNDTFLEQIGAAAEAHIQFLSARGIADPARIITAGHSYGGFLTANLVAHTDLFVAGIARSGVYNRSLTPFGFQSERRTFWNSPDVYDKLSPFRYADRIKVPLLLIHGSADDNPGTETLQSERLFDAIQATGGTARLVILPHEGHNYEARESVLHVIVEQAHWAIKYTE